MPAKLPGALVHVPEPLLKDVSIGETVFVECFSLRVTPDGNCYLKPEASVMPTKKGLLRPLQVHRASEGYHVTVLSHHTWTKDAPDKVSRDYIPVASITMKFDD